MGDVLQDHVQPVLFAPAAVEIRLSVGIVQSADHAQMQVEVRSATDGALIDLWSAPHVALTKMQPAMATALAELARAVSHWAEPFP